MGLNAPLTAEAAAGLFCGVVMDIEKIEDLTPDSKNANRGTERGLAILEDSLRKYGAGRSILVDKAGQVIAGNKTLEVAADLGLPVRVVKTDGHELVVVQREDLDLDDGDKARQLAYADNRSSQVGLDWDLERILADVEAGVDLNGLWGENELEMLVYVSLEPFGETETERDGQAVASAYGQMQQSSDRVHVSIGADLETWLPATLAVRLQNCIERHYNESGRPHFETFAAIIEHGCDALCG